MQPDSYVYIQTLPFMNGNGYMQQSFFCLVFLYKCFYVHTHTQIYKHSELK